MKTLIAPALQFAAVPALLPAAFGLCLTALAGARAGAHAAPQAVAQAVAQTPGAAPQLAQESVAASQGRDSLWRGAHGISALDGELWALGPDYRARFDAQGIEYTPAFGKRASRTYPTRFELLAWGRSEGPQQLAQPAQPLQRGSRVVLARGHGLEERYAPRRDGLELSFALAERPAGRGELVVQLAVRGDLCRAGDARALALEAPGLGALTIGGVTGIDAAGARAAGALRWSGEQLELSLPAAFVDCAQYPLVLDPLLGVEFELDGDSSNLFDDVSPAVAHDSGTGSYLAVWTRAFSINDMDVRGQRVGDAGLPLGALIAIESGASVSPLAASPAVGNCRKNGAYLVAWESAASLLATRDLLGRAVNATTGAVSSGVLTIASTSGNDDDPAIAGEASGSLDDVVLVWSAAGLGIRSQRIRVPTLGMPLKVNNAQSVSDASSTSFEDLRPAIAKSASDGGYLLVAWERLRTTGAGGPQYDIVQRVLDDLGVPQSPEAPVNPFSNDKDETHAAVACRGTEFALVYQSTPHSGGSAGIYAQRIQYLPITQATAGSSIVAIADSVLAETAPDIVYAGDAYVVAWVGTSLISANSPIVMQSLDPTDLARCGASAAFSDSALDYGFPALSSTAESTLGQEGGVLAVVEAHDSSSSPGEIWAQRYTPAVGHSVDPGVPSCGGETRIGCMLSDGSPLKIHLVGAPALLPCWAVVSAQPLNQVFGSCTLYSNPYSGLILFSGITGPEAHLTLPLAPAPSLLGVSFQVQHVIQGAGGPVQLAPGLDFFLSKPVQGTFE